MEKLDELMARPPATTSLITGEADPLDQAMETYIGSKRSQLNASLNLTVDTNPVEYARKKRIANLLGTPLEAVDALPQDAERAAKIKEIQTNTETAPKLRELYTDQDFARLANTDSGILASVERAFKALTTEGWGKSMIQDQLVELNQRALLGTITEPEQARRQQLKSAMMKLDVQAKDDDSAINYVLRQGGYGFGQLVPVAREGGKGGLIGALTGAGTAALLGQIGPQVALPEEVITVPAATVLGAKTGFIAGVAVYNYRAESGFAFDEFSDMKDQNGQPLPRDVVVGAATVIGLVNAGLETVGDLALARLFPGMDRLLIANPKEAVKRMLAQPSTRAALVSVGKKWVTAASAEAITEALQEISVIFGREAIQAISGQQFAPDKLSEDVERIGQAGMDAFVSSMFVGAAPSGYRAYREVREAKQMQQNQEFIAALGENAQASELAKNMPEKFQEFVAKVKEGGPVDNIYIPSAQWQTFFQSQGVDPAEVATQAGATNYVEAIAAGTDIVIPVENYAAKLAGSQFHAGLAPDLRLRQGDMTAREYEVYMANREAEQQALQERIDALIADQKMEPGVGQAVEQIIADTEQQLITAGVPPSTARTQATLMRGIAVLSERETMAMAAREGRDVTQEEVYNNALGLWDRYGLTVSRPLPDVLIKDTRSDISIDPLLDRLRAGDFPDRRKIYGKSLVDFLREKGGLKPVGELTDVDRGRGPFERNLIQETGMTLDEAASLAVEAGYLQGRTIADVTENDLVSAIETELAGDAVFSDYEVNPELYAIEQQLDSLQEYLSALGIDLKAVLDNAEVRRLMDEASAANPELGDQVNRYMQGLQRFYQGERIPDADYRVMRREFDNLNEAEQRVFDDFINSRPDGKQLLKRLQDLKGTPWALQATEGIFVRQAILTYANGATPDFQSMFDHNQVKTARELVKKQGIDGMFMYLDAKGYIGDAAKPINNVSSSFLNCFPSENCAKYCYATEGHYRYAPAVVKAEMVTLAVEMNPERAAQRTAVEYKASIEFAQNKALRLFDKGDGNAAWLPYIKALNAEGVRVHIFSKVPSFLRQVPAMNLRLLSIDESNLQLADSNPDLPVAMVYGGTATETEALAKMVKRGQVQVVLPIKIGRRVFTKEQTTKLKKDVPGVAPYVCPIDGGIKKIGPKTDESAWNCTKCDKNGGVGCYHGTVTKTVMESAEVKPLTNQDKASRILELRRLINEFTAGSQDIAGAAGAVAQPGSGQQGGLQQLLSEVDNLMGDLLRDYEPDAETRVAIAGAAGVTAQDQRVQGDTRPAGRVIPIKRLYQSDVIQPGFKQPTFLSALEDAISGAKQASAPASDWLAIVKKLSGVKKEEIEWSGLGEYLELRGKDKVTRDELVQYMADNGVRVEEVMLGNEYQEIKDALNAAEQEMYRLDGNLSRNLMSLNLTDRYNVRDFWASGAARGNAEDIQKISNLNLSEEQQQLVAEYGAAKANYQDLFEQLQNTQAPKYGTFQLPGGQDYRELALILPGQKKYRVPKQHTMGEKADINRLAHIRFNERTDADGNRVLFIEEIQSDWAQEGRKRGFAEKPLTKNDVELVEKQKVWADGKVTNYVDVIVKSSGKRIARFDPTVETDRDIAVYNALMIENNGARGGVAQAPFVGDTKAWVALSVKRMIRYAAENGFDKVAFINGEQSADRYDLSKEIDELAYQPERGQLFALKNGRPVLSESGVTLEKLPDFVGKEIAERLITSPKEKNFSGVETQRLSGVDLKVGGEGMKSFYDQIVPQVVNDVLKKVGGGKLETTMLPTKDSVRGTEEFSYMVFTDLTKPEGEQVSVIKAKNDEVVAGPFEGQEEARAWLYANDPVLKTEQLAFTITDAMRDKAMEGLPLFQGEMDDKRGYIQFGPERKFNIALLEKANLSTFLHETGHFYLEVIGDLAEAPNASDQVKADYAAILKFLGVERRDQIEVKHHEKFARANEAYLMEGNAPSAELRSVFQKFKSWLNLIYRELRNLNVQLNDEVRGVFDRIYASDMEIEAAKADVDVSPLLIDAQSAGMTEAEFAAYRASVEQTTAAAKDALEAKLMREYLREQKAWWKEELAKVRDEVAADVDAMPVYMAFKALTEGKIGDTPIKLNKEGLVRKYGEDYVKRLPRTLQRVYTNKGGMDADAAAAYLGYNSGDELIEALVGMKPRNEYIDAEAQRVMRERHGDMLLDGTMAEEARIALHNTQRENVLMIELRALRKKQREVAPFVRAERQRQAEERRQARAAADVPPASAFRDAARGLIGQTAVRNLNPYGYLLAGRKASREAFEAMAKGDYPAAATAKQRELLNHFLYLEASKARQEADSIMKYMRKFEGGTTRQQMGKAGWEYLDQIDALLDRYEFARISFKALDRRKNLALWVAEQEALGNEPAIDITLLDETRRANYREIPMDELRAVRDAVKNIEHLARLKNKLKTKQAEIEFKEAIDELVASAKNNFDEKTMPIDQAAMTRLEKVKDRTTRLDAMLIKMEQLVMWLDGNNVNGPWHTYLWNPIADAQVDEYDLTRQITMEVTKALEAMPKEQRLSMLDTFDIPGMGRVTRKFLVSIAMNMGNAGNLDKMLRGYGWDIGTVRGALAKLNKHDIEFAQKMLDTINSLWPMIAELEKDMTGLAPPKVESQSFELFDEQGNSIGSVSGYYPLVYDPRKSTQGAQQETGNLGQLFEEGYVRATTPKGHTKMRTEGFAAPLLLDFEQVTTQHLAKVIKDLTHRRAIVAANKILTNQEIRNVLQETLGPAYERQMLPWLRSVVNDRNGGSTQGLTDFSRWMMTLRANVVAATMGFKATTVVVQFLGLSQSLDMVKGKYLGQALSDFLRHPIALTREVRELSGEMRHRSDSLDRDIRDQLRNLTGQNSAWAQAQRFAFHGIALADAVVSVPTWMGAYRQALAAGADQDTAVREADAAVRLTQSAGGQKDLAAIQRNNELAKALTMFYSYFSALYSRLRDMGRDVQEIRDMPRFLARVFWTVVIPATAAEIMLGRGPDDDEDEALWAIRKVLLYPLMTVPIMRDVIGSIDSGFDYRFSPIASGLEKIGKLAKSIPAATEDGEWGDVAVNAGQTFGYVFGVAGTAQIAATGKYLWRVSEGEEQPDNLAELIYYASLGKRQED